MDVSQTPMGMGKVYKVEDEQIYTLSADLTNHQHFTQGRAHVVQRLDSNLMAISLELFCRGRQLH